MPDHPYLQRKPDYDVVRLERLRVAARRRIGPQVAESLAFRDYRDLVTGDLIGTLEATVMAETLPPLTIDDRVAFTVPRFATWFDQWLAAHWDAWWLWTLRHFGLLRRRPRYVDEPHTHTTTVNVRTRWTYPRATTVLPGDQWGHVVLQSQTDHRGESRPW